MRRIWGKFVAFDAKIHARFASHFSRILPIVDAVLEWIHGAVSAPPFGIILTLVLVVLVETHVISTIVALALGLAWVVAFIWIARSKPLRKLTILTRMLVLTAIGIGLGAFLVVGPCIDTVTHQLSNKAPPFRPRNWMPLLMIVLCLATSRRAAALGFCLLLPYPILVILRKRLCVVGNYRSHSRMESG